MAIANPCALSMVQSKLILLYFKTNVSSYEAGSKHYFKYLNGNISFINYAKLCLLKEGMLNEI